MSTSSGTHALAADLALQRDFLRETSPAYAALLGLIEAHLPSFEPWLERPWGGRQFTARYERPVLLLAALRFDALYTGPNHPLFDAIACDDPDPTALDADRLRQAFDPKRRKLWGALAERHVQTNETSRAVAWLWPASIWPMDTLVELFDLGASAGLNLLADKLPKVWTDETGALLPTPGKPKLVSRRGFDARPLDVSEPDDALWLTACVWPEQKARLRRLSLALDAARVNPPQMTQVDAEDMPAMLIPREIDSRLIAYQSLMRDYLPKSTREAYEHGMREFLLRHPPGRAVWMELEQSGRGLPPERSSALTAHAVNAKGEIESLLLARTHPHPSVLFREPGAYARLRELLTA